MSDSRGTPVQDPPEGNGADAEPRPDVPAPEGESSDELDLFAPLPDDRNPALIDARKTYIITILSSVLFCGAIIVFLLL